jgi:membrane protease YdiL (CAAX protease family)
MVRFFALVFALALPFWVLGAAAGLRLTPDLPLGALAFICPAAAAMILVYQQAGAAGVAALLRRTVDDSRIRAKAWYLPTLLLLPGIYLATYGTMRLVGLPLPPPRFPILAAVAMALAFFVAALGEELGWSGYAIDPMQARWGALRGSLLLGAVWTVFHYVPLLQAERSLAWIAWWALGTGSLRVLITWIYNNTGRSVFAAALFHATSNLTQIGPFLSFGPAEYPYDAQRISGLLLAVAAALVTIVWGPSTLTRSAQA